MNFRIDKEKALQSWIIFNNYCLTCYSHISRKTICPHCNSTEYKKFYLGQLNDEEELKLIEKRKQYIRKEKLKKILK